MLCSNSLSFSCMWNNHFFWNTPNQLQQIVENSIKIIQYWLFLWRNKFTISFFYLMQTNNTTRSLRLVKKLNQEITVFFIVWIIQPNSWHICYASMYMFYCYSIVFSNFSLDSRIKLRLRDAAFTMHLL